MVREGFGWGRMLRAAELGGKVFMRPCGCHVAMTHLITIITIMVTIQICAYQNDMSHTKKTHHTSEPIHSLVYPFTPTARQPAKKARQHFLYSGWSNTIRHQVGYKGYWPPYMEKKLNKEDT